MLGCNPTLSASPRRSGTTMFSIKHLSALGAITFAVLAAPSGAAEVKLWTYSDFVVWDPYSKLPASVQPVYKGGPFYLSPASCNYGLVEMKVYWESNGAKILDADKIECIEVIVEVQDVTE
jgi:hypothetical protein